MNHKDAIGKEFNEAMDKWRKTAEERWDKLTEPERAKEKEKWQSAQSQLEKLLGF